MMSQKSGFTSIGLWNSLHLLAKIPRVHSTVLRALDNLWLYIRFRNVNLLLGFGRNTCSDKTNASSPTSTNGMDNPSASLGRKFSLLLSSDFLIVEFLHASELLDELIWSNSLHLSQPWGPLRESSVSWNIEIHSSFGFFILICFPATAPMQFGKFVLSYNSSAVRIRSFFLSSWHIGRFQTFPYCVTNICDNFTYSSSTEKVLIK